MSTGILIIDRDVSFRSSLKERLLTEGYRVLTSEAPAEIVRFVRRKRIDAILLNLVEFKREGLHLLAVIKEIRPLVQVILLNRSDQISLSIEAMNLGAFDDFLLPFDMKELLLRINNAVQEKRALRRKRKTWRQKMDDLMIAVSFAEAGEMETARRYLSQADELFQQTSSPVKRTSKKRKPEQ